MVLCTLGDYEVVLGTPWLRQHDPSIRWSSNSVEFTSSHCSTHCLPPVSPVCLPLAPSAPPVSSLRFQPSATVHVELIEQEELRQLALRDGLEVYSISFASLERHKLPLSACSLSAATEGDISEFLHPKPTCPADYLASLRDSVPKPYHDLLEAFSKKAADSLPPHHAYDLSINSCLALPRLSGLFTLSETELSTLRTWIKDNLDKGFIRRSTSSAGSPILFVKKKDGSLRLCVDYRGLNAITLKNRYPLPLISETLDRLREAKLFTALDLRGAYNLLRIAPGDEWKTAFRTRYGLFECMVVPFGLTNAPAAFQHLMNDIFRDILDIYVTCYLDDILIFSSDPSDHISHVREVLQRLVKHGLYVKAEKCNFSVTECDFLGYRVSTSGIGLSPSKVESMLDWAEPTCRKDVERFIGFANAYRGFCPRLANYRYRWQKLTRGDVPFVWSEDFADAFTDLKRLFTSAPLLVHYDPSLPTIIETDSSSFAISAILSQTQLDSSNRPIAYMSRKMTPAECNYGPRDWELLAVVHSIKVWRRYLEGLSEPFTVYTDHQTLQYFQTSRLLSRRLTRWSQAVNHHKYYVVYRPGKQNTQCDALSRRSEYAVGLRTSDLEPSAVLRPISSSPLHLSAVSVVTPPCLEDPSRTDASLCTKIAVATHLDPAQEPVLNALQNPSNPRSAALARRLTHFSLSDDDLLLYDGLVYVPDSDQIKLSLLTQAHDDPTSGHFGQHKVYELLSRNFIWPGMRSYVNEYVRTCDVCQHVKPAHHKYRGLLQPLPVPCRPWGTISWDHITDLPQSFKFSSILVLVDSFIKMAHLIPAKKSDTARDLARQFIERVFAQHGLPDCIVSDRGTTFTSTWWTEVLTQLRVKPNFSTAFHPQSDGQTERLNQTIEQYLRVFANERQDDWVAALPLLEFAYNNSFHSSIGMTPFYALYAQHPRHQIDMAQVRSKVTDVDSWLSNIRAIQASAATHIADAHKRHARYANSHRTAFDPSLFAVGSQVMLNRKNIHTKRPSRKLDDKLLGPFVITRVAGPNARQIALPSSMGRTHPVFHVSLLEPYRPNTITGRHTPQPPAPEVVDGEASYELEQILDSAFSKRAGLRYFVQWAGYGPEDNSWIAASETHADDSLVLAFHTAHPSKPGYTRAFPPAPRLPIPSSTPAPYHSPSPSAKPAPRRSTRQSGHRAVQPGVG